MRLNFRSLLARAVVITALVLALVVMHTIGMTVSTFSSDELALPILLAGTLDLFSTSTMLGVIANLKRPQTGLLNRYFAEISQSQTEEIYFDVDEGRRFLAPFVSPLAPAPVKDIKGFRRDTFIPAYIKERARWTPQRALRVQIGEAIGGTMSPDDRRRIALANELQDQVERTLRRKENMAFNALFNGKLVIAGEEYPAVEVNFGRHADLNADATANNLTGTKRWSNENADPTDNLDEISEKISELSGSYASDIVMDTQAWKQFRKNKNVKRDLELPKYDAGSLSNTEPAREGLVFKGTYSGYRIWVYLGFYTNSNGEEQRVFNGGYVLAIGDIAGVQHHGAIQDEESSYQGEFFAKSWVENEPSVRWIMTQSAPLVVPRRINACGVLKVLNDA